MKTYPYFTAFALLCIWMGLCSPMWVVASDQPDPASAETVPPLETDSSLSDQLKHALKASPDQDLQQSAEELSRRLYPVIKGIIKGQMAAIMADPERGKIPDQMYQAGKGLSSNVVRPFLKGFTDGSREMLGDLDKTVTDLRQFREENRELIDQLVNGLKDLGKTLRENPPSCLAPGQARSPGLGPPPPGLPSFPFPKPPSYGSPQCPFGGLPGSARSRGNQLAPSK
ncbi:hypothetical protein ACFL2Q_09585 [Thermodesulfobacteriota bacterium]